MPKRKSTEAEKSYGIGIDEVDEEGIEPEEDNDDDRFTGFAQDEENDIHDDELVDAYLKESTEDKLKEKGEK